MQPVENGSNRDHDIAPLIRQHGGVANSEAEFMAQLMDAIRHDDLDKARALLRDHGELAAFKDGNGVTALHGAAFLGFPDMVELLLTNNADVNARDVQGETPLLAAKMARHRDVAGLLIEHGGHE